MREREKKENIILYPASIFEKWVQNKYGLRCNKGEIIYGQRTQTIRNVNGNLRKKHPN